MSNSGREIPPLWKEEIFSDSDVNSTIRLNINKPFRYKKAVFISKSKIAFQASDKIIIGSIDAEEHITDEPLDNEEIIRQLLVLKESVMLSRTDSYLYIWDLNSPRGINLISRIEIDKSTRPLGYERDKRELLLCSGKSIDRFQIRHSGIYHRKYLKPKLLNKFKIDDWNEQGDISVCIALVHDGLSAVMTEKRFILLDLINSKVKDQFCHGIKHAKFSLESQCCLSSKHLIYFQPTSGEIIVRSLNGFRIIKRSGNIREMNFQVDTDHGLKLLYYSNFVGLSLKDTLLLTIINLVNTESPSENKLFWRKYIISDVDSGDILTTYTSFIGREPNNFFYSKLDERGIIVQDDEGGTIIPISFDGIRRASKSFNKLKYAYISCLYSLGHSEETPEYYCKNLITYDLCKNSLQELYCAHRILMLAIQDKSINVKAEGHYKWFETIYMAARELDLSNREREIMFGVFKEASDVGILSAGAGYAILTARVITKELREEKRSILKLGEDIISLLSSLEEKHKFLKTSFDRYLKIQSMTALISVALHFIPLLGSSVVSAITAAELFENLAIGELSEKFFELGVDRISNSRTLERRLLLYVGNNLEVDSPENRGSRSETELHKYISKLGTSPEELKEIFLSGGMENGSNSNDIVNEVSSDTGRDEICGLKDNENSTYEEFRGERGCVNLQKPIDGESNTTSSSPFSSERASESNFPRAGIGQQEKQFYFLIIIIIICITLIVQILFLLFLSLLLFNAVTHILFLFHFIGD